MKLCQLTHIFNEGGQECPTCGGPVNPNGLSPQHRTKPYPKIDWPDKEGIWHTKEGPKTAGELDDVKFMSGAEPRAEPTNAPWSSAETQPNEKPPSGEPWSSADTRRPQKRPPGHETQRLGDTKRFRRTLPLPKSR